MKTKKRTIIILTIILFCLIIIGLTIKIVKPFEKIRWAKQQEEIDDFLIYSQWDEYFAWRMTGVDSNYKAWLKIYPDYQTAGGLTVISDETYKYKEKQIDLEQVFKEPPKEEIRELTISPKELKRQYNIPDEGYFKAIDWFSNKKNTFYLWKEKYIINTGGKIDFQNRVLDMVEIRDTETGELYDYKYASIANRPEDAEIPNNIIKARYYIDAEGRIMCVYKYYNKLYCARLN